MRLLDLPGLDTWHTLCILPVSTTGGPTVKTTMLAIALLFSVCSAPALADAAKDGEKVFETNKCITCHTLNGKSGKMAKTGGPLDGVGSKRTADWMKKYLNEPTSVIKDAQMPKMELSGPDIDALVAYMVTLK
jgi:mono/diheme cytochrome c family protein